MKSFKVANEHHGTLVTLRDRPSPRYALHGVAEFTLAKQISYSFVRLFYAVHML